MQPECEDGEAAGLARVQLRALEQPLAEHPGAAIGIGADECRKLLRGALSIAGYVAVLLPRRLRRRSVLVVALSRLEWLVCKPLDWPVRRALEWLVREPLD